MKRQKKSLVVRILEWITGAEFMIFLIGASAMDSPDLTVPIIMIFQALAWLYFVGNKLPLDYHEDDWDDEWEEE